MAVAFLGEPSRLDKACRLRTLAPRKLGCSRGHVLECVPLQPSASYRKILFHVGTHGKVRRVVVLDGDGNRTRFDFSEVEVDTGRAALEFFVVPPSGTRIVER